MLRRGAPKGLRIRSFLLQLRSNRRLLLVTLWLGLAPLLASSALTALAIGHEADIAAWGTSHWLMLFVASSLTMALALTPTTFVALLTGYFLGWSALLPLVVAYSVAALGGYGLARWLDGGRLQATLQSFERADQVLRAVRTRSFGLVVLTRLSPLLPFAVMNLVLAVARVPLGTFWLAGTLGMLPRTTLMVVAGYQARQLREALTSPGSAASTWLTAALVLLSVVGLYVYFNRVLGRLRARNV